MGMAILTACGVYLASVGLLVRLLWAWPGATAGIKKRLFAAGGYEYLGVGGAVLQKGLWDCGVACLLMVAGHAGRSVSADVLGVLLGKSGTSMADLHAALAASGLCASGRRFSSAAALRECLGEGRVAIVGLERGYLFRSNAFFAPALWLEQKLGGRMRHWVVVTARDGRLHLRDPAYGSVVCSDAVFARSWNGTALVSDGPVVSDVGSCAGPLQAAWS